MKRKTKPLVSKKLFSMIKETELFLGQPTIAVCS